MSTARLVTQPMIDGTVPNRTRPVCFFRRHLRWFTVAPLMVSFCFTPSSSGVTRVELQPPGGAPVERILASEIGTRVLVIGCLGIPLGELFTIQGEWDYLNASSRAEFKDGVLDLKRPKDSSLGLNVVIVNNRQLDRVVRFDRRWVSAVDPEKLPEIAPRAGEIWELRGIETGGYRGTPANVMAEVYKTGGAPQAPYEFGFYTEIRYVSCRVVRSKKS
jgi:hypothetical protein